MGSPLVSLSSVSLLAVSVWVVMSSAAAQSPDLGAWEQGFSHQVDPTLPNGEVAPLPQGFSLSNWITIDGGAAGQPGLNALHACLIPEGPHRGEVLVWDGNLVNHGVRQFQPYSIVNPYWPNTNPFATGTAPNVGHRFYNGLIDLTAHPGELFCGGKTWLPDGKLFVAGGTTTYHDPVNNTFFGSDSLFHFDPLDLSDPTHPFGRWRFLGQLASHRWYPTAITDGARTFGAPARVLVVGGLTDPDKPNSYESVLVGLGPAPPTVTFEQRAAGNNFGPASSIRCFGGPTLYSPVPYITGFTGYPRLHVLTTGEFFLTGELRQSTAWRHPPIGLASYDVTRGQIDPATQPWQIEEGTSLIYPNSAGADMIWRIGGLLPGNVASDWVETCYATTAGNWAMPFAAPPYKHTRLNHARGKPNVTILPDGKLFAVGGIDSNGQPVLVPEMLTGKWSDMAAAISPRQYHSCSLLLPDGRVFTCGGEGRTLDYEIYQPPYITKGYERPVFGAVFDSSGAIVLQQSTTPLLYNSTNNRAVWMNDLSVGISIVRIVMMRPAALTHHDDGGQRFFELPSRADTEPGGRLFDAPRTNASGFPAVPPGWWMVFMVTSEGAPSNAYWVFLQ